MNDTMLKLLYQIYNQIWSTAMPSKSITLQLLVRATSDQVDHDIRFFFPLQMHKHFTNRRRRVPSLIWHICYGLFNLGKKWDQGNWKCKKSWWMGYHDSNSVLHYLSKESEIIELRIIGWTKLAISDPGSPPATHAK